MVKHCGCGSNRGKLGLGMDDVLRGQPVLRCGRKCANKSRPEPGLASIGHGGMRWHGTCLNGKASRTTSCRSLGNNVEHKDSNLPVMNLRLVNKGIATRSKNAIRKHLGIFRANTSCLVAPSLLQGPLNRNARHRTKTGQTGLTVRQRAWRAPVLGSTWRRSQSSSPGHLG